MAETENREGWVYVVVVDPENNENFLGLYDQEKDLNYIPAFESKEEANDCFLALPREKGRKYEIQAIHIEDLTKDASENGFIVAMVDGDGNIKQ